MMSGSNRKCILGVDGGQSSTLALICDEQGRIIGEGHGGPANHIHEPGGPERLESALRDSIQGALRDAECTPDKVTDICLGMTGAPEQARRIVEALFPTSTVQSHHDVVTALAGASGVQPGVVVIAGTGAIAYGRLSDGRDARSSGWGYVMGDEGGAYWLGIEAIRAACKAEDGRAASTELIWRIPQRLALNDIFALQSRIYSHSITRQEIASLAVTVTEAARSGDLVAAQLLAQGAEELAQAALAVMTRLQQIESGLHVYSTGGVFEAGALVLEPFTRAIAHRSPNSRVHPAQFSPIIGALFLGLNGAGVALNSAVIAQISATMPNSAILKRTSKE